MSNYDKQKKFNSLLVRIQNSTTMECGWARAFVRCCLLAFRSLGNTPLPLHWHITSMSCQDSRVRRQIECGLALFIFRLETTWTCVGTYLWVGSREWLWGRGVNRNGVVQPLCSLIWTMQIDSGLDLSSENSIKLLVVGQNQYFADILRNVSTLGWYEALFILLFR